MKPAVTNASKSSRVRTSASTNTCATPHLQPSELPLHRSPNILRTKSSPFIFSLIFPANPLCNPPQFRWVWAVPKSAASRPPKISGTQSALSGKVRPSAALWRSLTPRLSAGSATARSGTTLRLHAMRCVGAAKPIARTALVVCRPVDFGSQCSCFAPDSSRKALRGRGWRGHVDASLCFADLDDAPRPPVPLWIRRAASVSQRLPSKVWHRAPLLQAPRLQERCQLPDRGETDARSLSLLRASTPTSRHVKRTLGPSRYCTSLASLFGSRPSLTGSIHATPPPGDGAHPPANIQPGHG